MYSNITSDDSSPKTLYVGNLSPHVTEDLLMALFGQIGECRGCKIIHEPGNDPYAFIEFGDSNSAGAALSTMNKRSCLGKEMKVNWATTSGGTLSGNQPKLDSSKHFHIFVGDLAPDIDAQTLREAFAPFGEISDIKIMKDPQTLVHKGYGFVSFVNKIDAESAIAQMNGQWLGTRKIRTNWATRKVQPGGVDGGFSEGNSNTGKNSGTHSSTQKYGNKLDYNEVWGRASDTNTTVYCGGINPINEDIIRSTFNLYGQIIGIHSFPDRGYAFIRFTTKEAACNAICGVHGMEVNGSIAKCSWGKENIDISGNSTHVGLSSNPSSLYSNASSTNQNMMNGMNISNPWTGGQQTGQNTTSAWTTANYQWPTGYHPNSMNYWQGYPANAAAYQNAIAMQGWGVMPTQNSTGPTLVNNPQYPSSIAQYQQNGNGK